MNPTVESRSWDFSSNELPYQHQLFHSALRMTRSREDAEDLVQETYLRAYVLYGTYTEGTNLKAWLFSIMTSTCFTCSEVSDVLGIPAGTVASRLYRARRQLEGRALRHRTGRNDLACPPSRVRQSSRFIDGRRAEAIASN